MVKGHHIINHTGLDNIVGLKPSFMDEFLREATRSLNAIVMEQKS